MARGTTPDYDENASVQEAPNDWEWDVIREESPIGVTFDTVGEQFVGQFERKHHVDREPTAADPDPSFDVFVFRGRDGKPYALPNSYALTEAYENGTLKEGVWARLTYVKDIKTARGLNDMKDIRIEIRK